jgi:hypothetical protein
MSARRRTVIRASLAGLVAASALLGLGTGAANGSIPTRVVADDSTASGTPLTVWGHLDSARRDCLGGRSVRLFQDFADHTSKLVSADRSSRNGVWVAQGDISKLAIGLHVRVREKVLGRGRHRHTCGATSRSLAA